MKRRRKRGQLSPWFYVLVILILLIMLFPFLMMLTTALKPSTEAVSTTPTIFPREITFQHFKDVLNPDIFPFLTYLRNSFTVSLPASAISVSVAIFGAYALSKLNFRFKRVIDSSFYTVYMFSCVLLVVPLFKIISSIGLYNTRTSLILVMIVQTLPTAIFMLRSYFDTIPKGIEEAAMIDGLPRWKSVFYIIIPLSLSGIASVFVYAFMVSWNNFLFASILLSDSKMFTLTVGLNSLFNTPTYVWGRMMAASLLTALPVVILYAITQNFIKKNLVEGGVKQ